MTRDNNNSLGISSNDDTLLHILSYTDYESAVKFVDETCSCHKTTGISSRDVDNNKNNNNNNNNSRGDDESSSIVTTDAATNNNHTANKNELLPLPFAQYLWKEMYQRHGFSPQDITTSSINYKNEIAYRRQLVSNLLLLNNKRKGNSRRKKRSNSFFGSIPHSRFGFVPVLPDDDDNDNDDHVDHLDPPPVNYDCDSFLLTSTGTSNELLLLNPFTGTLAVASTSTLLCSSSKNNKQQRQHRQNQQQLLLSIDDYWDMPLHEYYYGFDDDNETDTTTTNNIEVELGNLGIECKVVFHNNNNNNDNNSNTTNTTTTIAAVGRRITRVDDDDVDTDTDSSIVEVMTWMRRRRRSRKNPREENDKQLLFTDRSVVRIRCCSSSSTRTSNDVGYYGDFWTMELGAFVAADAAHGGNNNNNNVSVVVSPKLFVNYEYNNNVRNNHDRHDRRRDHNNIEQELDVEEETAAAAAAGSSKIVVYPFVQYPITAATTSAATEEAEVDTASTNPDIYFPEPETIINCRERVTSLTTATTTSTCTSTSDVNYYDEGEKQQRHLLLVGTMKGNLQLWNLNPTYCDNNNNDDVGLKLKTPTLLETINVSEKVQLAFQRSHMKLPNTIVGGMPPIDTLKVPPQHLSCDACGFVTHHHCNRQGVNAILVWKKKPKRPAANSTSNEEPPSSSYEVVSFINLPISNSRRYPKIHYDGRRLIVYAHDHIGTLILVYHVYNFHDDIIADDDSPFNGGGGGGGNSSSASDDGGVFHLTPSSSSLNPASQHHHQHVRLANVIRHSSLGGFDHRFSGGDGLYMTCNERYIVVNTKAGNLLNDESPTPHSEGLLIIDMHDDDEKDNDDNNNINRLMI